MDLEELWENQQQIKNLILIEFEEIFKGFNQSQLDNVQCLQAENIERDFQDLFMLSWNNLTLQFLEQVVPQQLEVLDLNHIQKYQMIENHQTYGQIIENQLQMNFNNVNPLNSMVINSGYIQNLFKKLTNLKKLNINVYGKFNSIDQMGFLNIFHNQNNLETLSLPSCKKLNTSIFQEFINAQFKKNTIKELNIDYSDIGSNSFYSFEEIENLKFTKISIKACRQIYKETLREFFTLQTNLVYLNVKNVGYFSKKALYIVSDKCKNLETLLLSKNKIDNDSVIYMLKNLNKLKSLSLNLLDNLHPNFTQFIFQEAYNQGVQHSSLQKLSVLGNYFMDLTSLNYIGEIFKNLEILNFQPNKCHQDRTLLQCLDILQFNLKKLQQLRLKVYEDLNDFNKIMKKVKNFKNLVYISFWINCTYDYDLEDLQQKSYLQEQKNNERIINVEINEEIQFGQQI